MPTDKAQGIHDHDRYKTGLIPHDPERPTLRIDLRTDAPTPPPNIDWSKVIDNWPMFKNDALGDCGPACEGHAVELTSKVLAGTEANITDNDVVTFYSDVSGYNPATGENDNGVMMDDMLSHERKDGLAGRKPVAYGLVHVSKDNIKRAINAFGCLHAGVTLQVAQQQQTDNGGPWDYVSGSDTWGGHAILLVGYNDQGVILISWGMALLATWAWVSHCLDEIWAVIYQEHLGTEQFEVNADVSDIEIQFKALTGDDFPVPGGPTPTPPAPGPEPTPPQPAPSGDLTLDSVSEALAARLAELTGEPFNEHHHRSSSRRRVIESGGYLIEIHGAAS